MSGLFFFICSTIAISAPLAVPQISGWLAALRWQKEFRNKKEGEMVLSKSRLAMNVSSCLIATCSSAASSPIASKSPGMSGASGKLGCRMNLEASSFDAASTSQVRLKDAYLGRLKEERQGDFPHEKEENSEGTDVSESEPWFYKPVLRNNEACGKPLAGETAESISSAFQKSQNNEEATLEEIETKLRPKKRF